MTNTSSSRASAAEARENTGPSKLKQWLAGTGITLALVIGGGGAVYNVVVNSNIGDSTQTTNETTNEGFINGNGNGSGNMNGDVNVNPTVVLPLNELCAGRNSEPLMRALCERQPAQPVAVVSSPAQLRALRGPATPQLAPSRLVELLEEPAVVVAQPAQNPPSSLEEQQIQQAAAPAPPDVVQTDTSEAGEQPIENATAEQASDVQQSTPTQTDNSTAEPPTTGAGLGDSAQNPSHIETRLPT